MNLQHKIAVVTGAASGLGLATCKALASAGATVVGFDLDAGFSLLSGAGTVAYELTLGFGPIVRF